MNLTKTLRTLAATLLAVGLLSAASPSVPQRYEFTKILMGMPFKIVLYASDESTANAAAQAALARIRQLNGILSDYEPESELMKLCRTAGRQQSVKLSPDLHNVLTRALELSRRSHGAFDISVGPAVRLWRKSRRTKTLPDARTLAQTRELVDYRNIQLDDKAGTVELLAPGMQLDLGGIAAGFAVDEALRVLKSKGVTSALIDASGDIGVSEAPPGAAGWRIGIAPLEPDADPTRYLLLNNAAVTTSGDAWQFVEIDGKRYSHIVDPRTGLGLTSRSATIIVATDCTAADSYATAVSVLGPEAGLKLVEATPGMAAFILRLEEGRVRTYESTRLKKYAEP
jgi:thiamine biosynthesis lipoprotein